MVDLVPFRGLRFGGGTTNLGAVTAPPYDSIDAELAAVLRSRNPFNVVRLELATAAGERGLDPYRQAAATFNRWRADGVLTRDETPTLTIYEQDYDHPDGRGRSRQRGVLGALGLVRWDDGTVLPHEHVFRGPVEDRLRLLEALPANVSPVYLVLEEPDAALRDVLAEVATATPDGTFTDENGVTHRVWVSTDGSVHDTVRASMRGSRALMADGHHRYTTALEHQARHGGQGRILAFVVAPGERRPPYVHDGPSIRPLHRLLTVWPEDGLDRLRRCGLSVQAGGRDLSAAPFVRLVAPDGDYLVSASAWQAPDSVPDAAADLSPTLAAAVVRTCLKVPDNDVTFASDEDTVGRAISTGHAAAAVLADSVPLSTVWDVARSGQRMPPKSTSFFPKPRTGIVLRPLEDGRE